VTGPDWLTALALATVALVIRRDGLAPESLWLDDAWVAAGASHARWDQTLSVGLVSPGFTLLLRPFIAIGGASPLAAQLLPLAAGLAAPGLLYVAMVDRRVRRGAALLSGLLLLSAPAHVTTSVYVKQYTVEALMSVALLWSAWTILDDGFSRRRWARLLIAACLSFAISAPVWPVIVVAIGVAGLSAWKRSGDRRWIAATAVGAAAFGLAWALLVVAPRVNDTLREYWDGAYIVTDNGIGEVGASAVDRLQSAMGGLSIVDKRAGLLGVALAGAVVLWRRSLLGLLLVGPVAIAIALAAAHLSPIGTGRTDVYLYPSVVMLVGVALDEVAGMRPRRVGTAILVGALVAAGLGAAGVEQRPYPREDVRPLVRTLESEAEAGDALLVHTFASFAFALYADSPVEIVPSSDYATGWSIAVSEPDVTVLPSRASTPGDYEPLVLDAIEGRDRVWFLVSHSASDADAIRQVLRDQGFSRASIDRRRGAFLELWTLDEDAPADEG
jgi:4-amino-4-deoxy-L-arabinose transferase-like glycosyltransferase